MAPGPKTEGLRAAARRLVVAAGRSVEGGLRLIYPPRCALCGGPLDEGVGPPAVCRDCCAALLVVRGAVCGRCGLMVKETVLLAEDGCPKCRQRRQSYDAVFSLGVYDGLLRRAVLRMKRASGEPLARAMAGLMVERLGEPLRGLAADLVVAVPMHWSRRAVRGTNSPETIARVVGGRMGIPAAPRLLRRRRKTLRQYGLAPAQRFRNIRGAFCMSKGYHLEAEHVLLIDDVLTTGSTCAEAARALRGAGARRVSVAVVARAETR